MALNLFYEEPDHDRWLPYDRYPRALLRRIVRGPRQPGGMERYYLNLLDGLRRIGEPYRENPFGHARRHPEEPVGIVGKGHLLRDRVWPNPFMFGPAVFSHPLSDMDALRMPTLRKVLVSCDWVKRMYEREIDVPVAVWPAGVDTYTWCPHAKCERDIDVLVYDKIRWKRETMVPGLLDPILAELDRRALSRQTLRYGFYKEEDFRDLLKRTRAMVFLVEHETQGFAYLQALASGVPILAWDEGGFWKDPEFYPHRVRFEGVSAVPYWDERCGVKFSAWPDFSAALDIFLGRLARDDFRPRDYVIENLSLEGCARAYVKHIAAISPAQRSTGTMGDR